MKWVAIVFLYAMIGAGAYAQLGVHPTSLTMTDKERMGVAAIWPALASAYVFEMMHRATHP